MQDEQRRAPDNRFPHVLVSCRVFFPLCARDGEPMNTEAQLMFET